MDWRGKLTKFASWIRRRRVTNSQVCSANHTTRMTKISNSPAGLATQHDEMIIVCFFVIIIIII